MAIELEPVDKNNLQLAVETAIAIFDERDRTGIELEFKAAAGFNGAADAAADELRIVNPHYFLAKRDGVPVGVTGYYNIQDHEEDVWLGWIGVLDDFQHQGIGGVLVKEAFARAAANADADTLRIWTTQESHYEGARQLYKKMGFVEEPYKPGATDAAKLVTVFSKSVEPAKNDGFLWKNSAYYPIDCERFVVPELNERLGLKPQSKPHHSRHAADTPAPVWKRPHKGLE